MTFVAGLMAVLACIALLQCLAGVWVGMRFARMRGQGILPAGPPAVTVLKPLCGDEPLLEEALTSCFAQDYPAFQIVFGIQNPNDPALGVLERVRRRFPDRDIAVVVDPTPHGPNRKVANLINMLPSAKHGLVVISDSDLHLPRNYLERLVVALERPGTGLVTTLYIGVPPPGGGWAAKMGSTQISHGFLPGVLLSRALGREDCLGSTAMLSKETLERIGGFPALSELLAEDNVMGQRVKGLGLRVGLADTIPTATVPEPDLRALWEHEIRWTSTIRALAPVSLCGSTLQYPLFWALLAVLAGGGAAWSLVLFAAAWAVRWIAAGMIDSALKPMVGRPALPTPFWMLPLRDLLSVAEIAASFGVSEVVWRGHRLGTNSDAGPIAVKTGSSV
ncbi:MAG TPA: bacteriohopanetetrol glucosamine biosynthesis glycosyltransferase HpnI [Alphaproteobacteria bacterium]|jgi:ceramide glucosyltransferase|nr:bacteriohopanetetrol glucosamine biosynthesis glycosyltransferase HpnI [Alphaproteobacteria bacterium]